MSLQGRPQGCRLMNHKPTNTTLYEITVAVDFRQVGRYLVNIAWIQLHNIGSVSFLNID